MRTLKALLFIFFLIVYGCDDGTSTSVISDEQELNGKILFYSAGSEYNQENAIYLMDVDGNNVQKLVSSFYPTLTMYPSWYEYPTKILFFYNNYDEYSIKCLDLDNSSETTLIQNIGNIQFPRYYEKYNVLLYNYKEAVNEFTMINRIAYYDFSTDEVVRFPIIGFDARYPVLDTQNGYVYFYSYIDGNYDIAKVSFDGREVSIVLVEDEFTVSSIDISPDSKYLVVSRYNTSKNYVTVYDLNDFSIKYNIDVSNVGGGFYPTFTSDSKKILFVDGIAYNFTLPRNIFIMDINGDNLTQLTSNENEVYARPLNW